MMIYDESIDKKGTIGVKRCLIVFAKEPEKGRVKTRLKDNFTAMQLLNLYNAFLKDTIQTAKKINCEERILAFSATKKPKYLKTIAPRFSFYKQKGKDLGKRMHNAFVYAKENKAGKTVIIGSDAPDLPAGYIQQAFRKLDNHDIILGPSADGGYYLIGLKRPYPALFHNIRWSTSNVFSDTLRHIARLKKSVVLLPIWSDVDNSADLSFLRLRLKRNKNKKAAQWTRKILEYLAG